MKKMKNKLAISYIIIGALARIIPHPANFTPITSLCLFSSAKLTRWQSIITMLLTITISDYLLSLLHGYPFLSSYSLIYGIPFLSSYSLFTYSGFMAIILFSNRLSSNPSYKQLLNYVVPATFGFWLWTNFGVWLTSSMYSKNIQGFTQCFIVAIPFLKNSMAGNLIWTTIIFGFYKNYQKLIKKSGEYLCRC